MSQAYGKSFSGIYNEMWGDFAREAAHSIMNFYQQKEIYRTNKKILDVCCGTGQLALEFLKQNYQVVGIDLSPHMLIYARENTREYFRKGLVHFIEADASQFSVEEKFGLAVSTYDAVNHLNHEECLQGCFQSVFRSVVKGGYFIFDLNTRLGLEAWNGIHIDDSERILLIIKGIFNRESGEAITRVSGFVQEEGDCYRRFEEVVYNYAYDLMKVKRILEDAGWREISFVRMDDLNMCIREPEKEKRVFIVARK